MRADVDRCVCGKSPIHPFGLLKSPGGQVHKGLRWLSPHCYQARWHLGWTKLFCCNAHKNGDFHMPFTLKIIEILKFYKEYRCRRSEI